MLCVHNTIYIDIVPDKIHKHGCFLAGDMWCELIFKNDKTHIECRQTLGHPRSIIPTWSIMSPNNHLSFSKSYMLSVHEAINISHLYHLACQGSRNSQKSYVSNHSVVYWHGIENLSRLSKCTLPIISIPKPLKLSNWQISYPIWHMSIPDVCVKSGR